ncbi:hypothetical protein AA313_de0204749 [Arthrobotrys entomopaga]|nr:hypothetical protein AA313_de0204749 [Arthrobotrys entomopaga]
MSTPFQVGNRTKTFNSLSFVVVHKDSMKLYTKAQGTKTQNLIINLDKPEWMFDDDSKTLAEMGCEHETEVSFFNMEAYEDYRSNPVNKWD